MTETKILTDAYEVGRLATAQSFEREDGARVFIVPANTQAVTIPPLETKLPRIKQSVVLHDTKSFVAYVNRFKSDATQVFAEPGFLANGKACVHAALDYHELGKPQHVSHLATYTPLYSEQWQRWTKACGEPMKQAEFAEFIEECRADIREPTAANLLDIVRTFKANKKVDFDSVVYQPNGTVKLAYSENVQQTGSSGMLPEVMTLGIPVYFRGSVYSVPVFVRYRVGSGAVVFQLKIDRADLIEDAAFGELVAAIGEGVQIDPYIGRRG